MRTTSSWINLAFALSLAPFGGCDSSQHDATVDVDPPSLSPPAARVDVVRDVMHGKTVEDPYRWLEDRDSDAVKAWSDGQNVYARHVLGELPERPVVRKRIAEILKSSESVIYFAVDLIGNDALLALKNDPDKQQWLLVRMDADGDPASETALVDPNEIDPTHSTSIDWYELSHDGSLVAVSMSSGGSESGDIHVFDTATGEQVDIVTERVNGGTAGGDLAWFPDDSGYYYTRYPRVGERPEGELLFHQQIWQHRLGAAAEEDEYVLGEDFPRIAASRLRVDPGSGRLLVWTQYGDSQTFALYLRQPDGAWTQFSEFGDGLVQAEFGPEDSLYVLTHGDSPRGRILRFSAEQPDVETAIEDVPEGEGAIAHSFYYKYQPKMTIAGDRLYVVYQNGGPSSVSAFTLDGDPLPAPALAPISSVNGLTAADTADIVYATSSYVTIPQWFRYVAAEDQTELLGISSDSPVDYSDVEVVREFATSKDGTRIPVNILLPRGARKDGSNAIVVTGYGGYGLSVTPRLSMSRHILFEHGVLFAQANLRGGGEYGEEWHLAGNLTNKQNVFDDFAAVIRHLTEEGYADPDRVAIIGGSNGGLLMGATITQNPDIAAAVVSHVGIYDMLRVELDPNGEFNVPEFGTVKDPEQFASMHAYSPYHRIEDGVDYPPILLPTGANDPRVNPSHSRKFTARLQAAQDGGGIVLLRTSGETGHGGGTPLDELIELVTDQYAFLFHHLGVPLDAP